MSDHAPEHRLSGDKTPPLRLIQDVIPLNQPKPQRREVGDQASQKTLITPQMVQQYATLVGDENPLHVNAEAGKNSLFGTNIAHGMLIGSLFGPIIVNYLIGPGAIYRTQTLAFEAPVPVGETVQAVVTVTAVTHKPDKDIYTLQTDCFLPSGTRVVSGEAVIIAFLKGL